MRQQVKQIVVNDGTEQLAHSQQIIWDTWYKSANRYSHCLLSIIDSYNDDNLAIEVV